MFLAHLVPPSGAGVPAVQPELPDGVSAPGTDDQPARPQQLRRGADAGEHLVLRPPHLPAPPPQALQKAGGGGVCHHLPDGPPVRQCLQRVGVFAVRLLPPLPAGVVIELLHPVPRLPPPPPKSHRGGVHRTVVAGDIPLRRPPLRRLAHHLPGEEVIYQPCRRGPFPQHEPAVEGPLEHGPVSLPHLGRQARVVLHGEVEVKDVALPGLLDPLLIEPVSRPLRVAGEPQPGPLDRAPGAALLHKGAGHQNSLVQQRPRQGHPLDACRRPLVPSAEQAEDVPPPPQGHRHLPPGQLLPALESHPSQQGQHLSRQVPPHPLHAPAAQGESPPLEAGHGPQEEGQA